MEPVSPSVMLASNPVITPGTSPSGAAPNVVYPFLSADGASADAPKVRGNIVNQPTAVAVHLCGAMEHLHSAARSVTLRDRLRGR